MSIRLHELQPIIPLWCSNDFATLVRPFWRSISALKYLCLLLLLFCFPHFLSAQAESCPCEECPGLIEDNTGYQEFTLNIFNIQNNNLANPDQCVSKIGVTFRHEYVGDILMEVVSPSGDTVQLIGGITSSQGSNGQTDNTLFDVAFVPNSAVSQPGNFLPKWDNNQQWGLIGTRTGTFYPNKGRLEDFNRGRVNGTWTLRVVDLVTEKSDEGEILDFYVEFCDSEGLVCDPCLDPEDDPCVFSIDPAEQTVVPSENFCLPVFAENTAFLENLSFDLNWDPTVLQFDKVDSFKIEFLTQNDFDLSQTANGRLELDYRHTFDNLGLVLQDSTPIFSICFQAIGSVGDSTLVQTSGPPTAIDVDGVAMMSTAQTGTVQIAVDSTADCVRAVQLCSNESISIARSRGPGFETNEAQTSCSVGGQEFQSKWFRFDVLEAGTLEFMIQPKGEASYGFSLYRGACPSDANSFVIGCESGFPPILGRAVGLADNPVASFNLTASVLTGFSSSVLANEGETYFLLVDNFSANSLGFDLTFAGTAVIGDETLRAEIAEPDILSCTNQTIRLDATNSTEGANYTTEWTTDTGQINTTVGLYEPLILRGGNFFLNITDNRTGCVAETSVLVRTDRILPQAVINNGGQLDCNQPVLNLNSAGSSAGEKFDLRWTNLADISTDFPTTQTLRVDNEGNYELKITNTENGCITSDTAVITADFVAPDLVAEDQFINCRSTTAKLTAVSETPNVAFEWSENGEVFPLSAASITVNDTGIFVIKVTASNGCSTSDSVIVTDQRIFPTAEAGPPQTLNCNGRVLNLDGSASSQGVQFTYDWTTENGNFSDQNSTRTPTPSVDLAGLYTLSVTNQTTGCRSTDTVRVDSNFILPTIRLLSDTVLTCFEPEITIDATNSDQGDNFSIDWFVGEGGQIIRGRETYQPVVDAPGNYILNIKNEENGCVNTDLLTITADKDNPVSVAGNPQTLNCTNNLLTLDGSASSQGEAFNYIWFTQDGQFLDDSVGLMIDVNVGGTYDLLVQNTENGCTDVSSVTIAENFVAPQLTIPNDSVLTCQTPSLALLATSTTEATRFSWQFPNGNTNESEQIQTELAGQYVAIATATNGCTTTDSLTLTSVQELPNIQILAPDTITCIQQTVELNGANSEHEGVFQFRWFTEDGTFSDENQALTINPTVESEGVYTIQVINTETGCVNRDSVRVNSSIVQPEIIINEEPTIFTCAVNQVGVTADSDVANAEFQWRFGGEVVSETGILSATQPGIYTIRVINPNNNCSRLNSIEIPADTVRPIANAGPTKQLDCATELVTLDGSQSDIGDNFTYLWTTEANEKVSDSIRTTTTQAGRYSLVVVNQNNGCRSRDEVLITESINNPVADAGTDTTYCQGAEDLAFVLGGNSTSTGDEFAYEWRRLNQELIGESITQLVTTTDTFLFQVTNTLNNCSSADTVIVFEKARPVLTIETDGGINCAQNEITYTATSDITTADIRWIGETEIDTNILTVTDALLGEEFVAFAEDSSTGCKGSSEVIRVREDRFLPIVDAGDDTEVNCSDTLRLAGRLQNPDIEATIAWSTVRGNIVQGENLFNPVVDAAGTYILTVENTENFCVNVDSVRVSTDQVLPTILLPDTLLRTCTNETLTIQPTDLSMGDNFYYQWTNLNDKEALSEEGELTVDFAGTYQLQVIDSTNLCTQSASVMVIDSLNPPVIEIVRPDIITCLNNQVILNTNINVVDGTYEWTTDRGNILGSRNSPDLLVDAAGNYEIEVKNNANGCIGKRNIEVTDLRRPIEIDAGTDKIITCFNDSTVLATGTIFTPNEHLRSVWTSNNPAFDSVTNILNFSIDEPGSYTLRVVDTLSFCEASDTFLVEKNVESVIYEIGETQQLDCEKESALLGDLTVEVDKNYRYLWQTSDGNITSELNQAVVSANEAGLYTVRVENIDNGCFLVDSQLVTQNVQFPNLEDAGTGTVQTLTCVEETLILEAGNAALSTQFIYLWQTENGQITDGQNSPFAAVNRAGDYQLIVTDTTNQCQSEATISIREDKDFPVVQLPNDLDFVCTDESVNVQPTTLETVNNLAINWQALEGTILSETQNLAIDVGAPGVYILQVEDLTNSCVIEDTLLVTDNRTLPKVANLNDRMLSCTNASITLDASGSDFGSNIVYAWLDEAGNTLSNNTTLMVDEAGNYILEVTNLENSCVNTDTLLVGENINPPRSANLVLEAPSCDGTDDGYLEILDVVGGTQPYNYQLNTETPQGSAIFSDLAPNTYQLMIVDELGCEWDTIFTLQEPDAIEVAIEQSSDNLITGQTVDLTVITSVPDADIAEIIWSPEDLSNCFDCSTISAALVGPTEVGVTIIDVNGCENSAVRKIDVGLAPVPNAITPNGDGDNDTFMVPAIEAAPDAYPDSEFIVFNRWGDVLYRVSPYNNDWDGRNQDGKALSEGTYYYVLRLDTREGEFLKGDITILRR